MIKRTHLGLHNIHFLVEPINGHKGGLELNKIKNTKDKEEDNQITLDWVVDGEQTPCYAAGGIDPPQLFHNKKNPPWPPAHPPPPGAPRWPHRRS
jgi:hypothetical protein